MYEALSEIPVHIGVSDLKFVLFHALLPPFLKWSKEYPLNLSDCELRDKHWVELIPKQPDVDAVADNFFTFKGRNKNTKVFTPKQGIELNLSISQDIYNAVIQRLSELEVKQAEKVYFSYFLNNTEAHEHNRLNFLMRHSVAVQHHIVQVVFISLFHRLQR